MSRFLLVAMGTFIIGFNCAPRIAAEFALYSSDKYTDVSMVFIGAETNASYASNSHRDTFTSVLMDAFIVIG